MQEGVITRTVMGRPDEVEEDGYWDRSKSIPTPEEYTDWEPADMLSTSRGLVDYEPDIYYFNFAGFSGKFFTSVIDNGGRNFIFNAYTANYKNMRISINLDADLDEIESIEITTEDGVKYTFGTGVNYIERSGLAANSCSGDVDNDYITAWYLKSIELPTGNKVINFSYLKGNNKSINSTAESKFISINPRYGQGSCGGECKAPSPTNCTSVIENEQLFIDKIYTDEYEISFHKSETTKGNGYQLDDIQIKSLLNNLERSINFSYLGTGRLFLDKVWVNNDEPYVFNYTLPGSFPDYESFSVDFWGFYNGQPNTTYVPEIIYNGVVQEGANRHPDFDKTKYGTIRRITYPTKGYTEFEFEAHDYATQSTDEVLNYTELNAEVEVDVELGSGTGPFEDQTIIKINFNQYIDYHFYTISETGEQVDGFVSFINEEGESVKEIHPTGSGPNDKTGVIFLSEGVYTVKAYMENSGGYIRCEIDYKEMEGGTGIGEWRNEIVGGLRIKEIKNYDKDGEITTKKEYRYRQFGKSDKLSLSSLSSGKLMNEHLIFQYVNSQYMGTPPTPCVPAPTPEALDMYFVCRYIVRTSSASNNMRTASGSHIVYTNVTEYNGGFVPTNPDFNENIGEGANGKVENTYTFIEDGRINESLPYAPSENRDWRRGLPLQTTYFDKNGDTIRIEMFDYQFTNIKKIPGFKVALVAEHHLDFPYEYASRYYWYLSGNQSNTGKTVIEFKNNERMLENRTNYNHILGSNRLSGQTSYLPDGTILTKSFKYPEYFTGYNEANWINQLQGKYMLNQLISQDIHKTSPDLAFSGIIASKIVSYENNLPKKVFAMNSTEAASLLNINSAYINQGTYESDGNFYNAITVEEYDDAANIKEYKTVNDIPVSIIWGYNKNFPVAKIEGATYSDIEGLPGFNLEAIQNTDYFSDEELRNRLAPLRTISGALVTSNTYDPLSGITSSTDQNGKTTYYEYDDFGRLVLIRDDNQKILKKYAYVIDGGGAQTPTGLSAPSIEYNQIQLDWNDMDGTDKYRIYISTDGENYGKPVEVTASFYNHADLEGNTRYYYKITNVVDYLESGAASLSVTTKITPPETPVITSAVALSNSEIEIIWGDVANEENYVLSIAPHHLIPDEFITLEANTSSYIVSGLQPDQLYDILIQATNSDYSSFWSGITKCKTKANPVSVPGGLSASALSNASIQINWANASYEDGYKVYRSTSASGTYNLIGSVGADITSFTNDIGLSGNTTYYYKVKAYNSDYESALSAYVSCKTKMNPPGTPDLTLSCSSSSVINLSWNDVANESEYRIYRGATAATISKIATLPAGTTSFPNTGLVAGNTYYYKVEAYNVDYQASSLIKYTRTIPSTPGSISGETSPCTNSVQTYSVAPVNGAATYEWSIPLGWTINSGQGSRIITVTTGTSFKSTLKVRAGNTSGNSEYSSKVILSTSSVPPAAGSISGDASVIPTDIETYSISAVIGATSYNWTVPTGSTILSGQGTTSITVKWGLTSGYVRVRPSNCAGSSTTSTQKYVTVQGGGSKF
jgi:YD repeat-containing protein